MIRDDLYLEIVTPDEVLYDAPVGLVDVPGSSGRFVLLRDHASIISTLTKGDIRVIGKSGVEEHFKCREGVLECHENTVVILMGRPVEDIKGGDL